MSSVMQRRTASCIPARAPARRRQIHCVAPSHPADALDHAGGKRYRSARVRRSAICSDDLATAPVRWQPLRRFSDFDGQATSRSVDAFGGQSCSLIGDTASALPPPRWGGALRRQTDHQVMLREVQAGNRGSRRWVLPAAWVTPFELTAPHRASTRSGAVEQRSFSSARGAVATSDLTTPRRDCRWRSFSWSPSTPGGPRVDQPTVDPARCLSLLAEPGPEVFAE